MKLSPHDLQQLDEDALRHLPEAAMRHLSLTFLADLKESRSGWRRIHATVPARLAVARRGSTTHLRISPCWWTPQRRRPPRRRLTDHPPHPPATRPTGGPRDSQAEKRRAGKPWGPPGSDGPRSSRPIPPKTTTPRFVPAAVSP